jgi:hypothetical protein
MVVEATESLGITKGSNHSSGSRSPHSTYSGPAKIKHGNRRKNDSTPAKLFFVFILCCTKWLRIEARKIVKRSQELKFDCEVRIGLFVENVKHFFRVIKWRSNAVSHVKCKQLVSTTMAIFLFRFGKMSFCTHLINYDKKCCLKE